MTEETHDYSGFEEKAGPNLLAVISGLALDQKAAEKEVADAEEALKAAQAKLKDIAEHKLPQLMEEAKMTEFTTDSGIKVKIDEKIRGSIPVDKKAAAFDWLKEHNHDHLIKRKFEITFNREEEKWAEKFQRDLAQRKNPLKVEVKRDIHPSTLASFVSGQLEAGVDFPLQTFGVYRQRSSKISFKE